MPGLAVRDRPDRATPRKAKKADEFPPARPESQRHPTSVGESFSTYSIFGRRPKSNATYLKARQLQGGGVTGPAILEKHLTDGLTPREKSPL
jgi:hypothetical protein